MRLVGQLFIKFWERDEREQGGLYFVYEKQGAVGKMQAKSRIESFDQEIGLLDRKTYGRGAWVPKRRDSCATKHIGLNLKLTLNVLEI